MPDGTPMRPPSSCRANRSAMARWMSALADWPALEKHVAEMSESRVGVIAHKGWLGEIAARRGKIEEARATIQWLRAQDPKQQFGYAEFMEARILAVLGEKAAAVERLRDAMARWVVRFELFSPRLTRVDRAFDSLRDDPEFKKLIAPQD